MNKLIFLGTGNARSLSRKLSSIILTYNGKAILIDCGDGMGTVRQYMKSGLPLTSLTHIFLTHRHADHISGISHMLFHRLIGDHKAKVRVIGPKETIGVAREICWKTHDYLKIHRNQIAFVPIRSSQRLRPYPGVSVTAIKVGKPLHYKIESVGYIIQVRNKSFAISGDARPIPSFIKDIRNVDILIHECTNTDEQTVGLHQDGHSTPTDAGRVARESDAKKLILTHLPDESRKGLIEDMVHTARKQFSGEVIAAEDGMEIEY